MKARQAVATDQIETGDVAPSKRPRRHLVRWIVLGVVLALITPAAVLGVGTRAAEGHWNPDDERLLS
jgi:hypothetical protein